MNKKTNRFSDSECLVFEKEYTEENAVIEKLFENKNFEEQVDEEELYSLLGEDDE